MSDLTVLLQEWSAGRHEAREELLGLVYEPLREMAERQLHRERDGHTLSATALVHELYLRLVDQRRVDFNDRSHFYAVAAQVMRRILVDHARRRKSDKRGGGVVPVTIDEALEVSVTASFDVLAVEAALESLEAIFPQQAKIVELRFYGGLTIEETAQVLAISPATVSRDWAMARAWLRRALASGAASR